MPAALDPFSNEVNRYESVTRWEGGRSRFTEAQEMTMVFADTFYFLIRSIESRTACNARNSHHPRPLF
jgi:hypothetical protein